MTRYDEVFDEVVLGDLESERAHRGVGGWVDTAGDYGHQPGGGPHEGKSTIRGFGGMAGVELSLPPDYDPQSLSLELTISGPSMPTPDYTAEPRPGRVRLCTRNRAVDLGTIPVDAGTGWQELVLPIPPEVMTHPQVVLMLDEMDNFSGTKRHRFRLVHQARITGRRGSAPRPVLEPTPDDNLDLVLVLCPAWGIGMPPIASVCLYSYLVQRGYRCWVIDLNIAMYRQFGKQLPQLWQEGSLFRMREPEFREKAFELILPEMERWAGVIADLDARFVGFSTNSGNFELSRILSTRVREINPHSKIVFGGPFVSLCDRTLLGDAWDYQVFGEGEVPLEQLLRAGDDATSPAILRRGDSTVPSWAGDKETHLSMDAHPPLDFTCFDMRAYDNPGNLPLLISKGCINRCHFCTDWMQYAPFRHGTAGWAYGQMRHLTESTGANVAFLTDLLCNGDLRKLRKLADQLVAEPIGLRWSSYAAVRKGMTPELLEAMRAAGCLALNFGIESGSTQVLRDMNKRYDREMAIEVLKLSRAAGIAVTFNLIVGFPTETEEMFQETMHFLEEVADVIDCIGAVTPFAILPNTPVMNFVEQWKIKLDPADDRFWTSPHTTHDIRWERTRRVQDHAYNLGLSISAPTHTY
jgi:radical SAM superfamily enzyme YgiQ (UPF0313 family)